MLGSTKLYGYVFKDGQMAGVTIIDFTWEHDELFRQTVPDATLTNEAGRSTTVHVDFFGTFPLVPNPELVQMEGGGSATIDGREDAGWMEVAWPKAYLDHIRTVPQYKQAAGKPQ